MKMLTKCKVVAGSLVLSASAAQAQVPDIGLGGLGNLLALDQIGGLLALDGVGGLLALDGLSGIFALGDLGGLAGGLGGNGLGLDGLTGLGGGLDLLAILPTDGGLGGLPIPGLGGDGDLLVGILGAGSNDGLPILGDLLGLGGDGGFSGILGLNDGLGGIVFSAIGGANEGEGFTGNATLNLLLKPIEEAAVNLDDLFVALSGADFTGRFYVDVLRYVMPIFDATATAVPYALLEPNGIFLAEDILTPVVQTGVPVVFTLTNIGLAEGSPLGALIPVIFDVTGNTLGIRAIAKPHDIFAAIPFSLEELQDPDLLQNLKDPLGIELLGLSL